MDIRMEVVSMRAWLEGDKEGYYRGLEVARKLCDYASSVEALSDVLDGLIEKTKERK